MWSCEKCGANLPEKCVCGQTADTKRPRELSELIRQLDGLCAVNLKEPTAEDLPRVHGAYVELRSEYLAMERRFDALAAELEKTKHALRLTGEGRPSEWAYTQLLNDFKKLEADFKNARDRGVTEMNKRMALEKQVAELKLKPMLGCDNQCAAIQSRLAECEATRDSHYVEFVRANRITLELEKIIKERGEKLAAAEADVKKFQTMASLEHHLECHEKWRLERAELLQFVREVANTIPDKGSEYWAIQARACDILKEHS